MNRSFHRTTEALSFNGVHVAAVRLLPFILPSLLCAHRTMEDDTWDLMPSEPTCQRDELTLASQ